MSNRLLSTKLADLGIIFYVLASVTFDDGSIPVQAARVFLVATAATDLTSKPFKGNAILVWQFLFASFVATSILWAQSPANATNMASTVLVNAVCLVVIAYLIQGDPKRLNLFFTCMMVAPVLLMLRVASSNGLLVFYDSRFTDTTSANTVGMASALAFCLAYLGFSQRLLASRSICGVFMFLNMIITVLSASRKALILIGIVIILFSLLNRPGKAGGRLLKTLIASTAAFVGYRLIMDINALYLLLGNRIETMINGFLGQGEVDSSTSTRLNLIENGIQWFQQAPWLGHGGDNFRALMEVNYPRGSAFYSHNNYIELLVGYGVVGFVLFYWMYVLIIGSGLKRLSYLNPLQTLILSVMIALAVLEYGFVDYYSRVFMAFVTVAWVAICTDTIRTPSQLQTPTPQYSQRVMPICKK